MSVQARIGILRWPWKPTLAVSLVVLAGCAYALISGNRIDSVKAAKIETGVQELRQLSFKQPVPLVVKSRDEAEAMMEADMMRDNTDHSLQVEGVVGALTGLYPAQIDLKAESLKLLKSQVAGFYDPHGKEMVLVKGGADIGFWNATTQFMIQRDIAGEMLLAHELTHALQDQNFDLDAKLDQSKADDDRQLALKSVAEGDATLTGFAYAVGAMDNNTAELLSTHLKNLPQALNAEAPDTPLGLSAPLLFQYSEGVRFVAEAYRRGGWPAVDDLYRNPPQSSHQILHPSLYFDKLASPAHLTVAGYQKIMGGWKPADDNSYGELLLRVILERNLGPQSYELDIATRLIADRMVVLEQSRGVSVIWMLAFTDDQTASHFAVIYAALLDRLLGDATAHRVDYHSSGVLVLIGEGANYFDPMAASIWAASTIESGGGAAHFPPSKGDLAH